MSKVMVNSRGFYFDDQGEGEPLILLCGLGGDHRGYGVTTRHFSTRYRVLALDNRDSGRSDRAVEPYSTGDMAADVAGWMDALGVSTAKVLGHSLGGLVAQELAIQFPEKVQRLVLASTHAGVNPWRRAVIESWIISRKTLEPADFSKVTMPWLVAPAFFQVKPQVDGLIRFAERNEWPQGPDALARQARAAIEHDARGRLGAIRCPTLVVVGALDLVNPPEIARELVDGIPGARLSILDGVGHLPHIEDGARFRAVVGEFLDG